jgi:ketosteroid isomerase-like protein
MVVQKGKYLCTWEKQADGSWKAAHDMWNSDAK